MSLRCPHVPVLVKEPWGHRAWRVLTCRLPHFSTPVASHLSAWGACTPGNCLKKVARFFKGVKMYKKVD